MLDAEALRAELEERWARIDVVAETGSTNTDLLADHAAPDRTVLVAERQTAGRGRLDRTWESAAGSGLTFSVLVRPEVPIATWGWLPLLAGLAVCEAVTEEAGVAAGLKWPNDVLIDGHKVAGVLAQTSGEVVVIGIGLNVTTGAEDLPVPTATSLALCGASSTDRSALLVAILRRLDSRLAQWADVGGDAEACGLAAAYRAACVTLGQQVAVTAMDGRTLTGTAVAVDPDGRLRVTTADGEQTVGAGDVEHVRPE